ncbi:sulfite exporter TauE/SafE family protein [Salinibius halmophilus]|uniref:sulfite exporter TauE/SafE family protein n=1 Tax=Salinibius halmophilus TaxID=1853216 RepID=UPI000E666276|nr:sulfite exporter TauE/SafE family protein [Salinibius halmophilus]
MEWMLLASAVMVFAALVQACTGYGYSLIAVPLLFAISPSFVPVPVIIASLPLMAYVATKNRFALQGHPIIFLLLGLALGAPLGALALLIVSPVALQLAISLIVVAGVVVPFSHKQVNRVAQFIAGMLSNLFGTATGVGGPPIALLYQHQSSARIRAVLATTFFFGSLMSLVSLSFTQQITSDSLLHATALLPGVLLGTWLGNRISKYIKQRFARWWVVALSMLSLIVMWVG